MDASSRIPFSKEPSTLPRKSSRKPSAHTHIRYKSRYADRTCSRFYSRRFCISKSNSHCNDVQEYRLQSVAPYQNAEREACESMLLRRGRIWNLERTV